jgi:predicted nucleic acid-binding protein
VSTGRRLAVYGAGTPPRKVRPAGSDADLVELAGSVAVPAAKRGTPWEEVAGRCAPPGRAPDRERVRRPQHPDPAPDRRPSRPGGARATRFLTAADELLLADLVVAEVVSVLESFYEVPRVRVAELVRAILAFPAVVVLDPAMLLRAVEVHETAGLDFAEAYLVAQAERSGVGVVASFDRAVDRVGTVRRPEPA